MKYGMNMFLWSNDVRAGKYLPIFERLRRLGYEGVEIPIFEPDLKAYTRMAKRLDDLGLERTAVTIRRPEHDPLSPRAAVRRKGIDQSKEIFECAQALGTRIMAGPTYAAIGVFSG